MSNEFRDWYDRIPFFTKWWLTLTIGVTIIARFNLFNETYLPLYAEPLFNSFQIWRPITSVFYYPMYPGAGFHFLINCYFLYNYSKRLESGVFDRKPADYFYMLLFNWICCVAIALLISMSLLMDSMVMTVIYMWCQLNKDIIISFWFGTRFKAMYLPWVLFGFAFIINRDGIPELVGILVGHLSFFLLFKYPQEFGGPALLDPPDFFKRIFPEVIINTGFGTAPRNPVAREAGHTWGRGNTLGGN